MNSIAQTVGVDPQAIFLLTFMLYGVVILLVLYILTGLFRTNHFSEKKPGYKDQSQRRHHGEMSAVEIEEGERKSKEREIAL